MAMKDLREFSGAVSAAVTFWKMLQARMDMIPSIVGI